MSSSSQKVLQLLASVTDSNEVLSNLDLRLYDCHVLDSLRTVQLIVAIEDEFGVKVSPAAFDRERWGTPRRLVEDIQHRLQK